MVADQNRASRCTSGGSCSIQIKKRTNSNFGGKGHFFLWAISLGMVVVTIPKIVINLPRTNKELHCRGVQYRFSCQKDPREQTDTNPVTFILGQNLFIFHHLSMIPDLSHALFENSHFLADRAGSTLFYCQEPSMNSLQYKYFKNMIVFALKDLTNCFKFLYTFFLDGNSHLKKFASQENGNKWKGKGKLVSLGKVRSVTIFQIQKIL